MRDPPGVLARYPHLRETPDPDPKQRTEWNVRDADATLSCRQWTCLRQAPRLQSLALKNTVSRIL